MLGNACDGQGHVVETCTGAIHPPTPALLLPRESGFVAPAQAREEDWIARPRAFVPATRRKNHRMRQTTIASEIDVDNVRVFLRGPRGNPNELLFNRRAIEDGLENNETIPMRATNVLHC